MGILELFALPAVMSLLILSTGASLAFAPRRMMRFLGDGFGFSVAFGSRGAAKGLVTRVLGLVLTGYGLYLMLHTVQLWQAYKPQ